MGKRCKVSIVMTSYNSEAYLRDALMDLLNQDYSDFEVICVDDGSIDKSIDILMEFQERDSRFHVVSGEHKGAGSARNQGIDIAEGEYLLVLDSDDRFSKNMLNDLVVLADENDTDIVMFDAYTFDAYTGMELDSSWIVSNDKIPKGKVFSYKDCPNNIFILSVDAAWNKLYRTEFIKKHNLKFQNVPYTNDRLFVQKSMILATRIIYLDKKLIRYRFNNIDSVSAFRNRQQYPLIVCKVSADLKMFLERINVYEVVKKSFCIDSAELMIYALDIVRDDAFILLFDEVKKCLFNDYDIENIDWNCYGDEFTGLIKRIKYMRDSTPYQYLFSLKKMFREDLAMVSNEVYWKNKFIKRKDELIGKKKWVWTNRDILKDKKIILYGAGDVGKDYYEQFIREKNGPNVLGWVDQNYKNIQEDKMKIESPSIIFEKEFDYVLIAVFNKNIRENIARWLSKHVSNEKIIWDDCLS